MVRAAKESRNVEGAVPGFSRSDPLRHPPSLARITAAGGAVGDVHGAEV
jgi:hypothetical protein